MSTPNSPRPRTPEHGEPWRDGSAHGADALLFATERGRALRCACCGAIELRFGNALLSLSAAELPAVLATLAASDAVSPDAPAAGATLTLGDTGCGWVFDAAEVAELHRLTAGAALMLDLG